MAPERIGRPRERSLLLSDGPAKLLQRLALSLLEEPVDVSAEEEVGIEHAFAASCVRRRGHPIPMKDNPKTRFGTLRRVSSLGSSSPIRR
jgi:hypothetical protein